MSVDIFQRWSSHYTSLKSLSHSSPKFKDLWNSTNPTEWQFNILEVCSITEFKNETKLKGAALEKGFRQLLLRTERKWMSNYSKTFCLNKDDKYFS
jgi:hypothetical protein